MRVYEWTPTSVWGQKGVSWKWILSSYDSKEKIEEDDEDKPTSLPKTYKAHAGFRPKIS